VSLSSKAQISLPYYTGFDDDAQKADWVEYKLAATTFSHWQSVGVGGAFSAPSAIGHDYSPSTGITLTDNWYVSPGFMIANGGSLDSIRYAFSGFSVPEEGDTVGLYLLNGSPDPQLSTSQTLLFDFRGDDYNTDATYRIKTAIDLPASIDSSYLAIRYRNTDCSSKWLTVNFDNIAFSENPPVLGLNNLENSLDEINVYPNPSSGVFNIDTKNQINSIKIYNAIGEIVYSNKELDPERPINISDYGKGIYFITYIIGVKSYTKKIMVI